MGKVAVVTGGTRGIGHAISVELKNRGYSVAANYGGNDEAAPEEPFSPARSMLGRKKKSRPSCKMPMRTPLWKCAFSTSAPM